MLRLSTTKSLGEWFFTITRIHSSHGLFCQTDEGLLSEVPSVCIPAVHNEWLNK